MRSFRPERENPGSEPEAGDAATGHADFAGPTAYPGVASSDSPGKASVAPPAGGAGTEPATPGAAPGAEPVAAEKGSFFGRLRRRRAELNAREAEEAALAAEERERVEDAMQRATDEEALRKRQAREQRRLDSERRMEQIKEAEVEAMSKSGDDANETEDAAANAAEPEIEAGEAEPAAPEGPRSAIDEQMIREAAEREATARLASAEGRRVQPPHDGPDTVPAPAPMIEPEPGRGGEDKLAADLAAAERRLNESQRRTAEAIERAAARLGEAEERARQAEERVERAEQLRELQRAESEQAERLAEMLDRIAAAEDRASTAETRVREAVSRAGESKPAPGPGEPEGPQRPA